MKKQYYLMVNGEYYSSGDFISLKNEAFKLAEKARKGSVLPESGKKIITVSICMYSIPVYNKYFEVDEALYGR